MELLSVFLQKYKKGYFLEREIAEEIKKNLQDKKIIKKKSEVKLSVFLKNKSLLIQTTPIIKQYLFLHQKEILTLLKKITKRDIVKII